MDKNNEINCYICLNALGHQRWKCLQCNQFTDVHCITEWLNRSKTCPLCRYQYLDWDVQQILSHGQRDQVGQNIIPHICSGVAYDIT